MATTPVLRKPLSQANTTDTGVARGGSPFQGEGDIAPLLDGGLVIVWTDESRVHNDVGSAVIAQLFDASGTRRGGEVNVGIPIGAFAADNQFGPRVAVLSNGNIAVAYVISRPDLFPFHPNHFDVYVSVLNPSLGLIHNARIAQDATDPALTTLEDGFFALTYTALNTVTGDGDVFGAILSSGGFVQGFTVLAEPDGQGDSELAALSNGNVVSVMSDEFNGSPTDIDVRFAIHTVAGNIVNPPLGVEGAGSTAPEYDPDVAALNGGGFVVTWTEQTAAGELGVPGTDIYATIYDNHGAVVRSDFRVNAATGGDQIVSDVVALVDGGFVVSWNNDGAFSDSVLARRFDARGNPVGSTFTVMSGLADTIQATLLGNGRFAYALTDRSSGDADMVSSIWDPRPVSGDLNNDGKSDIVLQGDGTVAGWFLQNGAYAGGSTLATGVPPGWSVVGTGDFNRDGLNDVVLQGGSMVVQWFLDAAGQYMSGNVLTANMPAGWTVVGTGDVNRDGTTDLVLQGGPNVVNWVLNASGGYQAGNVLATGLPANWQVVGVGDLNGDAIADVLLQGGSVVVDWLLNASGGYAGGNVLTSSLPAGWTVRALGDFNGDGTSDVALQGGNYVVDWIMQNGNVVGGHVISSGLPAGWNVTGSGDYNGDGTSDLSLQGGGMVVDWLMQNGQYAGGNVLATNLPLDWNVVGKT